MLLALSLQILWISSQCTESGAEAPREKIILCLSKHRGRSWRLKSSFARESPRPSLYRGTQNTTSSFCSQGFLELSFTWPRFVLLSDFLVKYREYHGQKTNFSGAVSSLVGREWESEHALHISREYMHYRIPDSSPRTASLLIHLTTKPGSSP